MKTERSLMKFLSSGSLSNRHTFPELCVGHTQQNFPELCDFRYARHFSPTLMQEIQLELRHMRRQKKSAMGLFLSNRTSSGYVAAAASPNKPISTHGSWMYAAKVRGVTQGQAIRQSCVDCSIGLMAFC